MTTNVVSNIPLTADATEKQALHSDTNPVVAVTRAEELMAAVEVRGRELLHVADEKAAQLKAKAGVAYADAKVRADALRKETEGYVRENPLTSVCVALGAGFVVGILARK
jgi:ElaB/YqjD/DUF883 family membrane-anchored ribosome-binding protein